MKATLQRTDGRGLNQMRDIRITYNVFEYAAGSVLFELGKTKVLCAVTLQQGVPPFLKGKRVGWLTAEYAMLPAATNSRSARESELGRRNGRSVEISRFIGRSLRTIVDLNKIGERTIIIDCDILQADGSTRTACITAASLALEQAQKQWLASGIISTPILLDSVAAVSIGLRDGNLLVDLNFEEDSSIDADFNIVLTRSGNFIEIQGAAERCSYTFEQLVRVQETAAHIATYLFNVCLRDNVDKEIQEQKKLVQNKLSHYVSPQQHTSAPAEEKVPFFSLKNRLSSGT